MNGAFYIGAAGLRTQQDALDAVANNIANVNTTAYKRATISFAEVVGEPGSQAGAVGSAVMSGSGRSSSFNGVQLNRSQRVFDAAALTANGNAMSLAIDGAGFIELANTEDRTTVWRGGKLTVNAEGYLATETGIPLKAMISVPRDASGISISRDGQVLAQLSGQQTAQQIGAIEIAQINDPSALQELDSGIYAARSEGLELTNVHPGADGAATIAQGFSEASNVKLSDEMVSMLLMQRAYSASAHVLQAGDDLMNIANGLKR
jgi:flagellar basal-body rod protein FlgG